MPQKVAQGSVTTYSKVEDWIYYVDQNSWNDLYRVRTDGTDAEHIMNHDHRITTINVADGVLYMSLNEFLHPGDDQNVPAIV